MNAQAESGRSAIASTSTLMSRLDLGHVAVVAVAFAFVALTVRPITDIDSYWHVLIGRELIDTRTLSGLGDGWTLFTPDSPWRTSQWAAEVVMAAIVDTFGWAALVWARTVLVVGFLCALCVLLLRRATPWAAAATLVLVAIPSNNALQERPMLVSFLLLVWLSGATFDLLVDRRSPGLIPAAVVTVIWAQFHGMWILAPFSFLSVAACLAIEWNHLPRARIVRCLQLALVTGAAGCLSPTGPQGLLLPLTFRSATSQISEWQKVPFVAASAAGILLMTLIVFAVWARRPDRLPLSHVAYVAGWTFVGMTAYRNLLPAAIMLAPLVAATLSKLPAFRRRTLLPEQAKALAVVGSGLLIAGVATVGFSTAAVDPLSEATPLAIARQLADEPGEHRVLNAYNASGVLAAFGGDNIRLGIDGRTDRYGGEYIDRYLAAIGLRGDWEQVLNEIDPTIAVIPTDSALAGELVEHRGWSVVMEDGQYALLEPPTADTQP